MMTYEQEFRKFSLNSEIRLYRNFLKTVKSQGMYLVHNRKLCTVKCKKPTRGDTQETGRDCIDMVEYGMVRIEKK